MFSLIISIIAVALGAVLLLTSAFYGGDSLQDGNIKAKVSQYKNEAHQISSALTLYKVEKGGFVTEDGSEFSWDDLVTEGYLKRLPQSVSQNGEVLFSWGVRDNMIYLPNVDDEVCLEANRSDGYQTNFENPPTSATIFGPNGETSPAGFTLAQESDDADAYIPVCDDALSDRVPCCYDDTPTS